MTSKIGSLELYKIMDETIYKMIKHGKVRGRSLNVYPKRIAKWIEVDKINTVILSQIHYRLRQYVEAKVAQPWRFTRHRNIYLLDTRAFVRAYEGGELPSP